MIGITTEDVKALICPILSRDGISCNCRADKCMAWQWKEMEIKEGQCIIMNYFWK